MRRILIVDDVKGWRDFNSQVVRTVCGEDTEIITAESARQAYEILFEKKDFYAIITDLQMEEDYAPKYAGEWLVEQIKSFDFYKNTKIIMISATNNIRHIAEMYGVDCIPKTTALNCISAYEAILT